MLTEQQRARRRALGIWAAIVFVFAAIVAVVVILAVKPSPDPTQQWLNCIQSNSAVCPTPPGG